LIKEKVMSEQTWKSIYTVQGEFHAEVIRGLLEAQGISVHLSQEGAAKAYGLGVGPLAEVEIFVPKGQVEVANKVIERYKSGDFEEPYDPNLGVEDEN
jgi:hypothetical protein